jgi:acyl carrier protein
MNPGDIQNTLRAILAEVAPSAALAPSLPVDMALSDAGIDSLAMLNLLARLETEFGVSVEDDDLDGDHFVSIASMVRFLNHKLSGAVSGAP